MLEGRCQGFRLEACSGTHEQVALLHLKHDLVLAKMSQPADDEDQAGQPAKERLYDRRVRPPGVIHCSIRPSTAISFKSNLLQATCRRRFWAHLPRPQVQ